MDEIAAKPKVGLLTDAEIAENPPPTRKDHPYRYSGTDVVRNKENIRDKDDWRAMCPLLAGAMIPARRNAAGRRYNRSGRYWSARIDTQVNQS
jgi:hypothetical protein